jgi:hypothetical protein
VREITYHCHGPGCDVFIRSASRHIPVGTFLLVLEGNGADEPTEHDFCGWECAIRYGAARDQDTVIDVEVQ